MSIIVSTATISCDLLFQDTLTTNITEINGLYFPYTMFKPKLTREETCSRASTVQGHK